MDTGIKKMSLLPFILHSELHQAFHARSCAIVHSIKDPKVTFGCHVYGYQLKQE